MTGTCAFAPHCLSNDQAKWVMVVLYFVVIAAWGGVIKLALDSQCLMKKPKW